METQILRQELNLIFSDIYASKKCVQLGNPLPPSTLPLLKKGSTVTFVGNTGEIEEVTFICHSQEFRGKSTDTILAEVLGTEDELRIFCLENNLCPRETHLFKMVVKAYQFLKNRSPNVELSERSTNAESDVDGRSNSNQPYLPDVEKSCLELKEKQRKPGPFEFSSQSPGRKRSIEYAGNDETAHKMLKIEAANSSSENEDMEEIPHLKTEPECEIIETFEFDEDDHAQASSTSIAHADITIPVRNVPCGPKNQMTLGQKIQILKLRDQYPNLIKREFCELASKAIGLNCALTTITRILKKRDTLMAQD